MSSREIRDSVDLVRRSARLERLRARAPRYLFVALVAVLSLLGFRELVAPTEPAPAAPSGPAVDYAAEDFAQRFARAYLTYDPRRPGVRERALRGLVPDELEGDAGLTPRERQRVLWTEVAQNQEALGGGRVLVVAAGVSTQEEPLYLAVPIRRGQGGALALSAYPSLVGAPTLGRAELVDREEVDDEQLVAVVERVVANYIAGERQNLAADLAPEARVSLPSRPLRLVSVDDVLWAGEVGSSAVLATVTARDEQGTTWTLTYEVGVDERGGRSYVTFVEVIPDAT